MANVRTATTTTTAANSIEIQYLLALVYLYGLVRILNEPCTVKWMHGFNTFSRLYDFRCRNFNWTKKPYKINTIAHTASSSTVTSYAESATMKRKYTLGVAMKPKRERGRNKWWKSKNFFNQMHTILDAEAPKLHSTDSMANKTNNNSGKCINCSLFIGMHNIATWA